MDIKALFVTSEFPPDIGGIGSHVSELASALSNVISQVEVVHPRDLFSARPAAGSWRYPVEIPAVIKAEPFYQTMLHSWLRRRLRQTSFDIVHVHGLRPLAATRGIPSRTVFTNHTTGFLARLTASDRRKRRTARLLEHVDYLIAPSAERVEAAFAFGYRKPAIMISNGVDGGRFFPGSSPLRAQWGIGENEVVVLLARRLVEKNGIADFARALLLLKPSSFRVVVAGDGPERAKMVSILKEGNRLDRVHFLGGVPNTDMPQVYRACDLSVLPSLAEATSITGLEAMATALPLVGTRVGGIPAIIDDGKTGLLVNASRPDELAGALNVLLADAGLRRRFGAAARIRTEQEFAWPAIALRTAEVYRACLEAPSFVDGKGEREHADSIS